MLMDTFTTLSWNIRGINNSTARRNLQSLLRIHNPVVLLLQETKCGTLEEVTKDYLWSSQDHSWLFSPSRGHSGGLLTSWNNNLFVLASFQKKDSWIWIRGNMANNSEFINCVNIYSPNDLHDKKALWIELGCILNSHMNEAFCLMGDFNSIVNDSERSNCS